MSNQTVRQAARRAAREVQKRVLEERTAREKRLQTLGMQVCVELAERDEAVVLRERRAGEALRQMTKGEGMPLSEAALWSGEISLREAGRLRALALDTHSSEAQVEAEEPVEVANQD
ncbi:hypothetical protein K0651_13100 [Ornithinimicrobium sp. Arc0846-15]|nr:hypothetical protein [Ornithinimicrobium laminariae]